MSKKLFTELNKKVLSNLANNAENMWEIAICLDAIKSKKLYKLGDYTSFNEYVEYGELPLLTYRANHYAYAGKNLHRLGYDKVEGGEVLSYFGVSQAVMLLANCKTKVALSTLKRRLRDHYANRPQLGVILDPEQMARVNKILERFGMEYSETGRRSGVGEALLLALEAAAVSGENVL